MADEAYTFLRERLAEALENNSVFFVGAGISAPSGLPTFQGVSERLITTVSQGKVGADDVTFLSKSLRPEVVYQIGIDELGPEVLLSMEVLEGGSPNPYHFLLAEALRHGGFILTTNVDDLIEKACRRIGLVLGRDFSICFGRSNDEDFKDYVALIEAGERLKPCIFKLHGSIDADDQERKYDSIQFALRQVGKGLFEPRRKVLEYFHKNFDLWFLGYSCRDDFSVFPAFTANKSEKSNYWCEYDSGPLVASLMEDYRPRWELDQEESKPLEQERDIELVNINHLLSMRGESYKFIGNLGKLLETRLCADLGITFDVPTRRMSHKILSLDRWARRTPAWRRHLFVSRLFEEGLRWDKAVEFCQKAAKAPSAEQVTAQRRLADIYYKEATPEASENAIQLYQQSVDSLDAGRVRASLKASIANVLRRRGGSWLDEAYEKAAEAIKEFESSTTEFEREADLEFARCLNIYGLSLYSKSKYDKARRFFENSIRIKTKLGDVDGIAESENAFSIALTQEGRRLLAAGQVDQAKAKFLEAIEHARAAVEARRKIGNRRGYAQNYRNLAWPYSELMKMSDREENRKEYFAKARDGYKAGITAWMRITPPPPTEVVTFTNILVALYNDFCRMTDDQEEKREWVLEGLQVYRRVLEEPKLKDKALSETRPPSAQQNLHQIQELLLVMGLSAKAKEAEEMLKQVEKPS